MAESKGFFRHTAVCLRVALLLELVGENSPPDCFLPQTSSAPSLFESLFFFQSKKQVLQPAFVMAESKGFEPSNRLCPVTRFPIVLLRPARTTLQIHFHYLIDVTRLGIVLLHSFNIIPERKVKIKCFFKFFTQHQNVSSIRIHGSLSGRYRRQQSAAF